MSSPPKPTSIAIQDRDRALLRSLLESRVMTSHHATFLHFEGRREAAKKRLQLLKAAGYIAERARRPYEPAVLYLTRKALLYLRDEGVLANYPPLDIPVLEHRARVSDLTIRHELEIMDVKVAFHKALAESATYSLAEFSTWPLLYQFNAIRKGGREVLVKPDAFIRIHERERDGGLSEHTFFLEVDRSTETQDTLVDRAGSYMDYYRSGGFAVKNGAQRTAYKDYPFRVLMVFKTEERRKHLADRLLNNIPPLLTMACLAIKSEVTERPLGQIWLLPLSLTTPNDNQHGSFMLFPKQVSIP